MPRRVAPTSRLMVAIVVCSGALALAMGGLVATQQADSSDSASPASAVVSR